MKKLFSLILVLCIICSQAGAQNNFEYLDSLFNQYEKRSDFNGVVLIAKKGKVEFSRSIGYAEFDNQIKLNTQTPMHLASNTKVFTNMAIMILEERNLIEYDDFVYKYINGFPYKNITVRHLMVSTSGLKRLYNKAAGKDTLITVSKLIEYLNIKNPKLSFEPGDEFQSSVASYTVLAAIIEAVSNKSFERFITDEIFNPLQMTHTFLLTPASWDKFRAISYDNNYAKKEWFLGSYSGGIGIYSSAEDLLKWDQALYTSKLVSLKTITNSYKKDQLKDQSFNRMTLGGWMYWKGNQNLIFKNGDWVANNSLVFRDIERNATIIILTNRQNRISKFDLMDQILPELGYDL